MPKWLNIARKYVGTEEVPGMANNPQILEWFENTGPNADWAKADSIPWCAAFVNGVLDEAGLKGSGSLMARSFLNWGLKLSKPIPGAIAVFPRGKPPSGHVAIVESVNWNNYTITTIDGNVSDEVARRTRKINSALGFRWPKGVNRPLSPKRAKAVNRKTRRVLKKSRKWSIMDWFKWSAGSVGLASMSIDLGSASGVTELASWSNGIINLWQTWGIWGLVAICFLIVLIAGAVQKWMEEDVEEGRYITKQSAEDVDNDL